MLISIRALVAAALVLLAPVANAALIPESDLWPAWDASDETSVRTIDHSPWQRLLDRYLDARHSSGVNRFDYAGVTAGDKAALEAYVDSLQATDPRGYSRAEQRAYWINLYNAATVALVVDNYPVKSIRKIYGGLFGLGPWNEPLLTVAGESMSLNDIEHRILRPIWSDPRIHYAVNCASIGCPNLAARAYTAINTEELLDAGARAYVNHPRGARFERDRLRVSSIYDWYQVDFGDSAAGVIEHLARYAQPELAERLAAYDGKLRYDYDWELNRP
ncbi:MAG: DUF547 domain-containing protein [Gammaproteobacteria bacterium]|nr:DUF547 domain-containing protein [Gammaproteobacteria bacterium]